MKKKYALILSFFLSFYFANSQVTENFDSWSDGGYGGVSAATLASGEWETFNSICGTQNARTGSAIRFNDDSGANEYLLYKGLDGNGKDSGIGSISFWYRHWNGDSSTVEFQVQYSTDGGTNWNNVGGVVAATSATYTQFNNVVNVGGDDILIRVRSIVDQERLMIDDFEISDYASTDDVDFANVQFPPNGTIFLGDAFNVFAQAWENGVTNFPGQGAGLLCWIGYSTTNTDPSTWTNWVPATYNIDDGNNDEFQADIGAAIPAIGTYYYASRFQLNGGPFRYGGYNGGFWDGITNVNGILTVNPRSLDWCNLQSPANGTINQGDVFDVYAQVFEPGITDTPADQGPNIEAWIGYSTTDSDPSGGGWTWVSAAYNPFCGANCGTPENNDEYFVNIGSPLAPGTYYYASRFRIDGGSFQYGGYNAGGGGFWDGTNNVNGILIVNPPSCTPIFSDDFSSGLGAWGNTGDWTINTGELNHNLLGVESESYINANIGTQNLNAGNYEWEFCMRNGNWDPSGGNNFSFILLSNDADLENNTTGYAVGINQNSTTNDLITLYSVNNGTHSAVITSSFDWNANDDVCIRVTRNSAGDWELFYDANGGGEVSAGTATNNDYSTGSYVGAFFDFTSTRGGELWIDDVSVCSDIVTSGPELQLVAAGGDVNCGYTLDFGNVAADGSTLDLSIFVDNDGSADLDINSLVIAGGDAADFSIVSPTTGFPISITPGGTQEIIIRFTSTVLGLRNSTLTINNTDAADANDETACSVALTGNGITNSGGGDILITQYYEGSGLNKWIEVKNVSGAAIPANSYYIATYNQGGAPNYTERPLNGPPNQSVSIPAMGIDQVIRFKEPATLMPAYAVPGQPGYDGNPTQNMFVGSFSGDDIIVISPTNDATCYSNRIDMIGEYSVNGTNWGDRRCFVRKECTASTPSITFDINDWIEFTDTEVENPTLDTNPYLGQHFRGSTTFDGVGASGWTNGLPDRSRAVIIDDNYDTAVEGSFESCSLEITAGDTLDIQDGDYVGIVTDLTVNITGRLEIQNEGQLVMVEDSGIVTNDGTINVNKSTEVMQPFDYVYWSTPVDYASITPIPPPVAFILTEFNSDHIYSFNTANFDDADNNFFDDDQNDWSDFSSEMQNGVGYAAMTANTAAQANSVQFSGTVNNGVITVPLSLSADANTDGDGDIDDWNLVGNPYPSAISADSLISQNASIYGTLYFWTHNDPISITNPGPDAENFNTDDYASYNSSGGVAASTGGSAPTGFIASGQGFFVDAVTATSIEFNNSMRNVTFANDDFFRSINDNGPQKDRFWLNLTNPDGAFSQMLIAFFEDATLEKDRLYDGIRLKNTNYLNIYSMDNTPYEYAIQGRPSFENTDIIPVGFNTHLYGPMEIALHQREGVLQNESIYLIDYYLNITHDLTVSSYTFTAETGTFNDRFAIAFVSDALSIQELEVSASDLVIYETENDLVSFRLSSLHQINRIDIIDLLGRTVHSADGNNESLVKRRLNMLNAGPYLAKVFLGNGLTITKKFIKK